MYRQSNRNYPAILATLQKKNTPFFWAATVQNCIIFNMMKEAIKWQKQKQKQKNVICRVARMAE